MLFLKLTFLWGSYVFQSGIKNNSTLSAWNPHHKRRTMGIPAKGIKGILSEFSPCELPRSTTSSLLKLEHNRWYLRCNAEC